MQAAYEKEGRKLAFYYLCSCEKEKKKEQLLLPYLPTFYSCFCDRSFFSRFCSLTRRKKRTDELLASPCISNDKRKCKFRKKTLSPEICHLGSFSLS